MSEKQSPPHKEKAGVSKLTIGDGKASKRKLIAPGSPSEDEEKKKRKRPNLPEGASPEHMGMGSPRGAGSVSRLSVPLSERQQMAILMKMADESTVGDTSPKSPSSGSQVSSTTKRTPADKKVNKRNERGEAPLHMAAKRGDYRQTKHLLKAGACVNMKDYAGWTALHEACNSGNIKVARYLLKAGADVNVQGFDDDTPLHDASSNGHRKLVQLLLRHGADPHQANVNGKTAVNVAATSQIEAILESNSMSYSSDSESNSEDSSCDSIISTKDDDRNVEDDYRLQGSQMKETVGSSSSVTVVRRQSVPPSPDKSASSPRLFLKLQQKKSSSSSSSANEEQQRVSEWNVLPMETGSGAESSEVESSNQRAFEPRSVTSVSSSRLSKPEDSWAPRNPGLSSTLNRTGRLGLEPEGCPDSTVSSTFAFRTVASPGKLERTNTEGFTPRGSIASIEGDPDDDHGEVFPNINSSTSSSSNSSSSNKAIPASNSFNNIPICSSLSINESNKQLPQLQQNSLSHLYHNPPLRPRSHLSYQHPYTPPRPSASVSVASGLFSREQIVHRQRLHHLPNLPPTMSKTSPISSTFPLSHHRSPISSNLPSTSVVTSSVSLSSSSLASSTTPGASLPHQPIPVLSVTTASQPSQSISSHSHTSAEAVPPFPQLSTIRTTKAGGSIITGLSDRALAASSNVTAGNSGCLPSVTSSIITTSSPSTLSLQPITSTSHDDSASPRLPMHQRVEELSSALPKSDTSSCDSPLCMDVDDSNKTPSEQGSRPSTPKVPPLKIIMPGKAATPASDEFSKLQTKQALPYVLNPTQEGEALPEGDGEAQAIDSSVPIEGVLPPSSQSSASPAPASTAASSGVVSTSDAQADKGSNIMGNWESEETGSLEDDQKNDQADESGEDGKDKKSTRTLRSHTAMLQQQGKTPTPIPVTEKNGVVEVKEEGDNNSTTRSQKGYDSATDDSNIPPRKRKLRNKNEQPPPVTTASPPIVIPKIAQALEKPPNPYETYLNLRRQIANRHRSLCNVPPKPPSGFKDYLMVNCTYVLQGNATSTLSVPMLPPPNLVKEPMREFFIQQEKARYRLRLQHVIEREKLMLSIEQEMLREHARAARAIANQTLPLSVCTILREEEIYNQQELEQDETRDKNVRSRYNGRQFLSWLQDVDDKYEKIKHLLLMRHHHEAESLYAVQKLDWEWKMKEFGLCDNKNTPVIDDLHVPMVAVSDEFDLLPSS